MQPIFLLQLYSHDCHGYELRQGLQEFVSDSDTYDPSIIYRIMREMEENAWVESYEGKKQLARWMDDLAKTKDEINNLLTAYKH